MLENTLAMLENGKYASCYSSGMAAIAMICSMVTPGEHILSLEDVYGGTHKYFSEYCPQHKVEVTFADLMINANLEKYIRPNTKVRVCTSIQFAYLEPLNFHHFAVGLARMFDQSFDAYH